MDDFIRCLLRGWAQQKASLTQEGLCASSPNCQLPDTHRSPLPHPAPTWSFIRTTRPSRLPALGLRAPVCGGGWTGGKVRWEVCPPAGRCPLWR